MIDSGAEVNNVEVKVTRVSSRGIWLQAHDKKFFLSYYDFPWFKNKPVQAVLHVEEPAPGKFYWPEIDLRLEQDSIELRHKPMQRPTTGFAALN